MTSQNKVNLIYKLSDRHKTKRNYENFRSDKVLVCIPYHNLEFS